MCDPAISYNREKIATETGSFRVRNRSPQSSNCAGKVWKKVRKCGRKCGGSEFREKLLVSLQQTGDKTDEEDDGQVNTEGCCQRERNSSCVRFVATLDSRPRDVRLSFIFPLRRLLHFRSRILRRRRRHLWQRMVFFFPLHWQQLLRACAGRF
jgi:hypothetical protein